MKIHPTAIIHENVELGEGCVVEAYVVLGSEAEHKAYFGKPKKRVVIGKNCVIREYVTVNSGTERDTVIGDNCTLLRGSHVAHDCIVGNDVTLSCNSILGGHSEVMDHANLGLGSVVRQRLVVGTGVMLGMNAVATRNLKPWCVYMGVPAKLFKQNIVGLTRAKISEHEAHRHILEYKERCKKNQV
jgi:UDP-N-acetylglucosamine acyltransferase